MRRIAYAAAILVWMVGMTATASVITFEPDAFGNLPDGTPAVDDLDISAQYLASFGVSFGIDGDKNGLPDTGILPKLERIGEDGTDGFLNDTLSLVDIAATGFEAQLGDYFLRTPVTGSAADLLVTYASPVAGASAEIWDIDGAPVLGSEQWRIEALDASRNVIQSVLSPEKSNLDLDAKPYIWTVRRSSADIEAIRISFTGTKPSRIGLAFNNFSPSLNPIPEPSTIAVWSLLGLIGLGYGWRKKRKAA